MDSVNDGISGKYQNIYIDNLPPQIAGPRKPEPPKQKTSQKHFRCSENSLYYFQNFAENASIDGLKFLGESQRTIPERIFWAITLIVALVLCIVMVIQTFNKWISSPVIVSFATSQTSIFEIPFPAITICPEVKSDRDIFNYTEIYLKRENNITLTPNETRNFEFMSMICGDSDTDTGHKTILSQEMLDFLYEVSPEFSASVIELEWKGNTLKTGDLFSPILTSEGICYTFNMLDRAELFTDKVFYPKQYFSTNGKHTQWSPEAGYIKETDIDTYPRRTFIAGIKGGLSITFFVMKDQLDYACGDSLQGFKVTLHQPAEFPRVKQNYFRIPLGQSIVTSVKPNMMRTSKDLKSYDPQDRKCYFIKEKNLKYFKIYNQQNCLVECLVNFTLATCGCVSFHMPREESTPFCGAANQACIEDAKMLFLSNDIDHKIKQGRKSKLAKNDLNVEKTDHKSRCNCLPACYSLDFDVETSQSNWDWHETFKVLKESGDWNDLYELLFGDDNIRVAQMIIYFKDMQFLTSERNELYGYTEFWANVGGLVGLFTGFSFVTLFELFYYLTLRLWCNIKLFGRQNWSGSPELMEEGENVCRHFD